ncbi:MAG TPA: hypothetical protein VF587_13815 [Solirubrobacteraceae bacterium]|jgi:hypothetical protein
MSRRHLALAALAATAFAAVPSTASAALRSYGGETKDEQPIVLSFNTRTGKLDRVVVMFSSTCKSGKGYSFGTRLTRVGGRVPLEVKMRRGGRFTATSAAAEELGEGRVAGTGVILRGRVRGRSVTGTIEAATVIGLPDSEEPEDTCTYSRKSFSAINARGRVLTGETSQGLPVVMQLDARARNVRVLDIGWNAGCEPPGFIQIPDELLRFRIRGGQFGDDFDYTTRLDDGTERVFTYQLKGRASRRRASGTLDVVMEDKGGSAPGTCRTGPVTWRAS